MIKIYSKGFLENLTIAELSPRSEWSTPPKIKQFIRNVFDFWNNLVLNYSWEPIGPQQAKLQNTLLKGEEPDEKGTVGDRFLNTDIMVKDREVTLSTPTKEVLKWLLNL